MTSAGPAPITVIVLTHNEERNLPACLESVSGWAGEIFVVDSGSTDRTVEIAARYGARVVRHPFESHARQWDWALRNLPVTGEWVLALDADQRLTPELRAEITERVAGHPAGDGDPVGYFIKRRQIFRGRWIRHGYYPKYLLKLFRRGQAWVDGSELVDHHFHVRGGVAKLRHDLVEDNQNEADLAAWVEKHTRYAALQALEEFTKGRAGGPDGARASLLGSPDERVRWLKKAWNRLPLYVRPVLYFLYRYVLRLGFLDGKEGFLFHVLQGFWYRLLVDIRLDELRRSRGDPA